APVDLSLLLVDTDWTKAGPFVETHSRVVEWKRRQHQLVIRKRARLLDERLEQRAADALAAPRTLDVDRKVGDVVVDRARVERVQAAPADYARFCFRHDHRVARSARGEPAP